MNIVTKARGEGKTYDLIITSSITGYPIITATMSMAKEIAEEANKMDRKIPEPMSFDQYRTTMTGKTNVLIDEIDILVNNLLGGNVVAATHTQPF